MDYDPFDPFSEPPMYTDYFLKFADLAEADSVLFEPQHDGEGYNKVPKYAAVDVIGTIYKPTGNTITTDEGEVDEMAPLDGWHVNVRQNEEAPELVQYQVYPATPVRMWA